MRAAAILGLGCSASDLRPFQTDPAVEWRMGMPVATDQADVILLFGGDGTIHRHLTQLVKLGLPVLVVPAGSGNDFARSIGLRRVRDSRDAWLRFCQGTGNVRAIDLGIVRSNADAEMSPAPHSARYFSCVAGVGLDGEVTRRANRMPRWLRRHGGYALAVAPTIFTFAPLPMKISVPTENSSHQGWTVRSEQPTLLAAFANTPVYGGGMKVAPQAKMDDGLLDVCILRGVKPFKLLSMFPTVYAGRHLTIREVEYFQAVRTRIETEHPVDVYADGEYVGRTPVEISIQPGALRIVSG
jgi:Sphingosine kinase and enzymes related to eukaryotic diacylglycerol kinase